MDSESRTRAFIQDPPEVEFKKWVQPSEDHWLWTGSCSNSGSPQWGTGLRMVGTMNARRAAYQLFIGEPDGLPFPTCGEVTCVAPQHLAVREPEIVEENGPDMEHVRMLAVLKRLGFSIQDSKKCLKGLTNEEIQLGYFAESEPNKGNASGA